MIFNSYIDSALVTKVPLVDESNSTKKKIA